MKLKFFSFLISLFFVIYATSSIATEADASGLTKALEKIQTYKAHFSQKIHDANGEHVSKTQGEIMVHRPGKFYWKSEKPDPILVVADGKNLWTYDIDLSQVTKQELTQALGNSPASLLAGSVVDLNKNFDITLGTKKQCQNSDECYMLKPRQKDAPFADILIGFVKGSLIEVRMHDPLGQDVHTLFTNVKINSGVEDKIFAFVPPKGVDIIHNGN